jgi:hypothetical protein
MLEPGVHGPRVNLVRPGQLPDTSQPLKYPMIDDLLLPVVDWDEAMNWATDFVSLMRVSHPSFPSYVDNRLVYTKSVARVAWHSLVFSETIWLAAHGGEAIFSLLCLSNFLQQ